MSVFSLEVQEHFSCEHCGNNVPVADSRCDACHQETMPRLAFGEFFEHLERGLIIDAKRGGLVVGRDGPEDDIPMFTYSGGGIFEPVGLMQGGEFLVCKYAVARHHERLLEINEEKGELTGPLVLPITAHSSVINTNLVPGASLWIARGQFVVNRFATKKYLSELEDLNSNCHS